MANIKSNLNKLDIDLSELEKKNVNIGTFSDEDKN